MDAKEFSRDEYESRWERAQQAMRKAGLDVIIASSPGNYRYFAGHRTACWSIRDRLRLCALPAKGEPTVFLTALEDEWLRASSWITKAVHHSWQGFATWSERGAGIEELAKNLKAAGFAGKRIGMELGVDQRPGMTYQDIQYLIQNFPAEIVDASELMWKLRLWKSPREISLLQKSTEILDRSFDETWNSLREDVTETDLTRIMANAMRLHGAEDMSFIYMQSAEGPEEVAFRDPLPRQLRRGNLIYIDTGCIYKGYRSDYCRVVALGSATDRQREGYRKVYRVLHKCLDAVHPGATVKEIVDATEAAMHQEGFDKSKLPIRYGHSIGIEMPEPPSIAVGLSDVTIAPNTVLCLEPGAMVDGRYIQLEEMVLVTESGCKLMSKPAEPDLPIYK